MRVFPPGLRIAISYDQCSSKCREKRARKLRLPFDIHKHSMDNAHIANQRLGGESTHQSASSCMHHFLVRSILKYLISRGVLMWILDDAALRRPKKQALRFA